MTWPKPAALASIDDLPALVLQGAGALLLEGGNRHRLDAATSLQRLRERPYLVCHAVMLHDRLRRAANAPPPANDKGHSGPAPSAWRAEAPAFPSMLHFDVAELFAFVRPACAVPPLPSTLGAVLGLSLTDDDPAALRTLAQALLSRLAAKETPAPDQAQALAQMLHSARWPWAPLILRALGATPEAGGLHDHQRALAAWERLPEWEEPPPAPPPGQRPVQPEEAVRELLRILGRHREPRPDQQKYAAEVARALVPRPSPNENTALLAEAGTGLGKTLGYLAPAALWARRNAGSVWIATYTRNLQRQLLEETRRMWPEPAIHRRRVSVRKGRENYMCLRNTEETFAMLAGRDASSLLLAALLARWMTATRDGDMVGGDFPAWLLPLLTRALPERATPFFLGLTDRRGECAYAACRHYRKCFVERARARAERAELVIANHAVVLVQAAMNVLLGETAPLKRLEDFSPSRLVFDEGHHLFDAADSAFSGHLTMLEAAELRRWIRGAEGGRKRGRNLRERLDEEGLG